MILTIVKDPLSQAGVEVVPGVLERLQAVHAGLDDVAALAVIAGFTILADS